jgi:hypothetical protein
MNCISASQLIAIAIAYIKKPINIYFRLRSAISSFAGRRQLRRDTLYPAFHAHSESAATGHIQEQKERLSKRETTTTVRKTMTAAGCIALIPPPFTHEAAPNKPEIGRNPSIPSGRAVIVAPTGELTICINL